MSQTITEKEQNEEELVTLQNTLAKISKSEIKDIRRAFNQENKVDAKHYCDRFNYAASSAELASGYGAISIFGAAMGFISNQWALGGIILMGTAYFASSLITSKRELKHIQKLINARISDSKNAPSP